MSTKSAESTDIEGVGGTGIRTGLTLYSLSNEWWSKQYDLDAMLDRVAADDLGPGIEIVGFQTIRTYPEVTPEFVRSWRDGLERRGLVSSCLSSNIDVGQPSGRFMTDDEMVDCLSRQIETARLLGFHVIPQSLYATDGIHGYVNNGLMILPPMALISVAVLIWIHRSYNKELQEN